MSSYDPTGILNSADYRAELGIQRTYMARVYSWMTIGLLLTALTSLVVASDANLVKMIFGTGLVWVLLVAQIVIAFGFQLGLRVMPSPVAAGLFLVYSLIMGALLSVLLFVYTGASVAATFFVTAGMFGAMSVWGYVTKRDLTGMGSFLFMGLIGLIIASVVNMFMHSQAMQWLISFVGVVIFTGLTAYDTQKIKEGYAAGEAGSAAYRKGAIFGAFMLYLDFVNLFIYLLQFMGKRRD